MADQLTKHNDGILFDDRSHWIDVSSVDASSGKSSDNVKPIFVHSTTGSSLSTGPHLSRDPFLHLRRCSNIRRSTDFLSSRDEK